MVTIRVSLDFPIVFDRMRKTIFQFYRQVTWTIPIFLRIPPNCPSVKKYLLSAVKPKYFCEKKSDELHSKCASTVHRLASKRIVNNDHTTL